MSLQRIKNSGYRKKLDCAWCSWYFGFRWLSSPLRCSWWGSSARPHPRVKQYGSWQHLSWVIFNWSWLRGIGFFWVTGNKGAQNRSTRKDNTRNTEHPEELSRKSHKILNHISAYNKPTRPPIIYSSHNIKSFTYSTT